MKIPYTKKNLAVAAAKVLPRSVAGISDNIDVLNFFSTAASPAEARTDALKFVTSLLKESLGKGDYAEQAENVLAEATYLREDLDEPGKVLITYKWYGVFVRYSKADVANVQRELVSA